jgi:hypothetical protein
MSIVALFRKTCAFVVRQKRKKKIVKRYRMSEGFFAKLIPSLSF